MSNYSEIATIPNMSQVLLYAYLLKKKEHKINNMILYNPINGEVNQFDISNFKITNKIINKFLNPSKLVLECYDKLIESNNIDLNNTIFVWARSTDKGGETKIPSVEKYLKIINYTHYFPNQF